MKMYEKLDILLNRKRIRRVDFAESVGITYRAFAYYMSDTRKPRKNVLERIAKELDVTPEFLADDSVDMELTLEEHFIKRITDRGGDPTAATRFLAQSRGLLAGNSLSEEDKSYLMRCLTEIYEDSLKNGKK
ncbi:MAG: helix-turn-helix domain-containing protein [Lachnospiraceae bacterium]|nr:helix-turn-helix domain-containing protein [Ruminococcus sp.]MCM1274018.1 helix-turn-helix domain-containing protein [Lachnospiraceae bacterium]